MSPASGFSQLTLCAGGAEPLTGAPAKRGEHATAPSKWPICRTRAPGLGWRSRLASLLTRPSPPLWLGIVVAAVLILGETVLVELLGRVGPRMIFGAVYLLGVLVISFGWGIGLSVVTTLVSAVVYLEIHLATGNGLLPADPQNLVAVAVFVPIALLTNVLGAQARQRAAEARRATRQVSELARRQAALRRVATLVARGVSPDEIFAAVADEVANALGVGNATLFRFLDAASGEIVAAYDEGPKKTAGRRAVDPGGRQHRGVGAAHGRHRTNEQPQQAAGSAAALIRDLGLRLRGGRAHHRRRSTVGSGDRRIPSDPNHPHPIPKSG